MNRLDNECIQKIKSALPFRLRNTPVTVYDCIDSTNDAAKRAISDGLAEDAVFIANSQTNGRGRRGKSFYSPKDCGLYFTAVLHTDASLEDCVAITSAAAVAVVDCIKETTKKHPLIKWVNDVYLDGKKICGILVEAVNGQKGRRAMVIGIGINLTTSVFPSELSNIAGSLGEEIDLCVFTARLFERLYGYCESLPDRSFMNAYRKYSMILGREVCFTKNQVFYEAVAESINDNAELTVVTSNGERMVLNSGEVSIKPLLP